MGHRRGASCARQAVGRHGASARVRRPAGVVRRLPQAVSCRHAGVCGVSRMRGEHRSRPHSAVQSALWDARGINPAGPRRRWRQLVSAPRDRAERVLERRRGVPDGAAARAAVRRGVDGVGVPKRDLAARFPVSDAGFRAGRARVVLRS
eukprot:Amastigsp_a514509_9.p4 type:complete len:149 gc:universal Amastigsp_a514509_9:1382-936(-)